MSDELLRLYNNELQYLRRQGDEFARANPQIAANLRIGSEGDFDPYVGRLVEAFAYLNARTRQKIDDDFPEVAGSLLDVLLPHYQRPQPSSGVVQMQLDISQAELYNGYPVLRHSKLETADVEGEPCLFRTCFDTTVWPFELTSVTLRGLPFEAPKFNLPGTSQGLMKVTLSTFMKDVPFNRFATDKIRFFIKMAPPFGFQLYEMLMNDMVGVGIGANPRDERATLLSTSSLEAVGFAENEGLVEYPPQSFLGYRLLSEYFSMPEKFLFFDLHVGDALRRIDSQTVEIYFFMKRRWQALEPHIQVDSLQLGCTPIVNLFKKRAEPIHLTHFDTSYRVIPDSRRPLAHEIYSVDRVVGISHDQREKEFLPFYSFQHSSGQKSRAYWHASRRDVQTDNQLARGIEVDMTFVDLDFNPLDSAVWTINIETTCTNRNLPPRLRFYGDKGEWQLEGHGAIDDIKCLVKPTEPLRPPMGQGRRWRVVSHLSLNHLSLAASGTLGAEALREILTLYDFRQDESSRNTILGLNSLSVSPALARIPGDRTGALCRGLEVAILFEEEKYTGGNLFLFASVLERFLSLYTNLNSFTQTVIRSNRRQEGIHRWPPRAGQQILL